MCVQSSLGADTSHLQLISCADGAVTQDIASSDKSDLDKVLMDEDSRTVLAASFNYLRVTWKPLAQEVGRGGVRGLWGVHSSHSSGIVRDAT